MAQKGAVHKAAAREGASRQAKTGGTNMNLNQIAIGFLTKDRVELSRQTIKPLLQPGKFDLFWFDGSSTPEGRALPVEISLVQEPLHGIRVHESVLGGPDAAVAYALTTMLKGGDYEYIGLCENDVLLHPDWFGPTMALFDRGAGDGLCVGAVSTRCYEDRILFQRDGYAVCHNLGWGMQILTREAAHLALTRMRTSFTTENRRVFCQLSGLDIGRWWAFNYVESPLCADWHNDVVLASHGLASLALTPSPVEMIGQDPPLHAQGLRLATKPMELLRHDEAFDRYVSNTARIRQGTFTLDQRVELYDPGSGTHTIFPHQVASFGGVYEGDWRLKFSQGWGPFVWKAGAAFPVHSSVLAPSLEVPLSGAVEFLVSGGQHGGQVEVDDIHSKYRIQPKLPPEGSHQSVVALQVPASISYRQVRLTALSPGVCFYGMRCREPQPHIPGVEFDWHTLPPA
jgi:hypothetical protein